MKKIIFTCLSILLISFSSYGFDDLIELERTVKDHFHSISQAYEEQLKFTIESKNSLIDKIKNEEELKGYESIIAENEVLIDKIAQLNIEKRLLEKELKDLSIESYSSTKFILGNTRIQNIDEGISFLLNDIEVNQSTFYCGCHFSKISQKLDLSTCSYFGEKERATDLEWEHIVPISVIGGKLQSWREGDQLCGEMKGRSCSQKVSQLFNIIESDLYNLVPVNGGLNQIRSNYGLSNGDSNLKLCGASVSGGKFTPPERLKGDVARVYLYMNHAYPGFGIINSTNRSLIELWNQEDSISYEECARAQKVMKVQGNSNPFLSECSSFVY